MDEIMRDGDRSNDENAETDGREASAPRPPFVFRDAADREIEIREYAGEFDSLADMYLDVPQADRAQGVPPTTEPRVRSWLEDLLADGLDVLAWHDGRVVGHVGLLPMDDDTHELLVFVAHAYQEATIGTHLLEVVFGLGRERGVERIWLTVEGRNHAAINLYTATGFRTLHSGREYEMIRDV